MDFTVSKVVIRPSHILSVYQNIRDLVASNLFCQLYKVKYIYTYISTHGQQKPKIKTNMKPETLTLLLVNLAGIMERADESVLLGIYKEVGEALHTDPVGLGLSPFYCHCLWRSFVACHDFSYYLFLHLLTGTRYLFQFS